MKSGEDYKTRACWVLAIVYANGRVPDNLFHQVFRDEIQDHLVRLDFSIVPPRQDAHAESVSIQVAIHQDSLAK